MWIRYWWYGHPFHLRGHSVWWCYFCGGWGCNPDDTHECSLCYGRGLISFNERGFRVGLIITGRILKKQ